MKGNGPYFVKWQLHYTPCSSSPYGFSFCALVVANNRLTFFVLPYANFHFSRRSSIRLFHPIYALSPNFPIKEATFKLLEAKRTEDKTYNSRRNQIKRRTAILCLRLRDFPSRQSRYRGRGIDTLRLSHRPSTFGTLDLVPRSSHDVDHKNKVFVVAPVVQARRRTVRPPSF